MVHFATGNLHPVEWDFKKIIKNNINTNNIIKLQQKLHNNNSNYNYKNNNKKTTTASSQTVFLQSEKSVK